MSLLKKGLSDSKYYLIANLGNKALAFLIIPILAKSVGVEEFATYDLFLVISSFIDILIVLGIDSGIAIMLAESKNNNQILSFLYTSTLIISITLLTLVSFILLIIFLYKDELFLLDKTIWLYIIFYTLFVMINYHTFNFLRWQERAKEASFISLFAYIAGMLIGLLFLYFNNKIDSYIEGLVIGVGLGSIISLYITKEFLFNFKILSNAKELLKELFKLSLPFVPNYLGNSLMQMADRVIILMLFSKYELGIYAVIIKLAMIPQILIATVSGGFIPVMLRNYKSKEGKKLIRDFFHIYLLLIPFGFIVTYLLADWAIGIFASNEYLKYSYLLPIALSAILFVRSDQASGFSYSIKRKTHYIMYLTFLAVVLNYIFSYIFGYYIGLVGVIIGTLIAGIIKTYLYVYFSEKLYSFSYNFILLILISISILILTFIIV